MVKVKRAITGCEFGLVNIKHLFARVIPPSSIIFLRLGMNNVITS
jgi:hypothetical protein